MAIIKISELPAAVEPISGASVLPIVDGNNITVKATIDQIRQFVSILDFGADSTGVTDCTAALQAAVASGAKSIYFPKGNYIVTDTYTISLINDLEIYGEGVITYSGDALANNIWTFVCGGYNFILSGLTFIGSNLAAGGVYVRNTTPMTSNLPNATVKGCVFKNFRMLAVTDRNFGLLVAGSFNTVYIAENRIENITRAAGTGIVSISGTTGIGASVVNLGGGELRWIYQCIHTGNSISNISGGDAAGSAANFDYDGIVFASPNPSNFPSADGSHKVFPPSLFISSGNTYTNCRGRAIKVQGIANINDEKIIRNDGYCLSGGSVEIDLQYGVGTINDITFMYYDYLSGGVATSPLNGSVTLTSVYQGAYYDEKSTGAIVDGLTVYNEIKSGIANADINLIMSATLGYNDTIDRPLVSLSNVIVNRNGVLGIVSSDFPPSNVGFLSLNNISVAKITQAAMLVANTNAGRILNATNIINLDGVKTPANAKPFFRAAGTYADAGWGGIVNGFNIRGFELNYVGSTQSTRQTPMLVDGALTGAENHGALSVQSVAIADDGTHAFDRRGVTANRLLVAISVNYDSASQAILACGDDDVYVIAARTPNDFEASTTGSNPDIDGKINVWFVDNKLRIKNRLGSSRTFTLSFLG